MPQTDAARARAQRVTIALFVAAAVLAAVGVTLLFGLHGTERPATASAPATPAPSASAVGGGSAGTRPAEAAPAAEGSGAPEDLEPRPVPTPVERAAEAFVTAWASHDARPGRDTSYDDASRRAAAHAAGDLAEDLRTHTSGRAAGQQWLSWKDSQVQVTVRVLRVSLPDGAPAPSADSSFARVIYKLTETPAKGPAVESEEHVALKLRRGADGSWRVVGLPNV
jgi:ketosteroid isomerase-like protein